MIEAEKAQEINDSEVEEESTVKSGNYESLQDEDK